MLHIPTTMAHSAQEISTAVCSDNKKPHQNHNRSNNNDHHPNDQPLPSHDTNNNSSFQHPRQLSIITMEATPNDVYSDSEEYQDQQHVDQPQLLQQKKQKKETIITTHVSQSTMQNNQQQQQHGQQTILTGEVDTPILDKQQQAPEAEVTVEEHASSRVMLLPGTVFNDTEASTKPASTKKWARYFGGFASQHPQQEEVPQPKSEPRQQQQQQEWRRTEDGSMVDVGLDSNTSSSSDDNDGNNMKATGNNGTDNGAGDRIDQHQNNRLGFQKILLDERMDTSSTNTIDDAEQVADLDDNNRTQRSGGGKGRSSSITSISSQSKPIITRHNSFPFKLMSLGGSTSSSSAAATVSSSTAATSTTTSSPSLSFIPSSRSLQRSQTVTQVSQVHASSSSFDRHQSLSMQESLSRSSLSTSSSSTSILSTSKSKRPASIRSIVSLSQHSLSKYQDRNHREVNGGRGEGVSIYESESSTEEEDEDGEEEKEEEEEVEENMEEQEKQLPESPVAFSPTSPLSPTAEQLAAADEKQRIIEDLIMESIRNSVVIDSALDSLAAELDVEEATSASLTASADEDDEREEEEEEGEARKEEKEDEIIMDSDVADWQYSPFTFPPSPVLAGIILVEDPIVQSLSGSLMSLSLSLTAHVIPEDSGYSQGVICQSIHQEPLKVIDETEMLRIQYDLCAARAMRLSLNTDRWVQVPISKQPVITDTMTSWFVVMLRTVFAAIVLCGLGIMLAPARQPLQLWDFLDEVQETAVLTVELVKMVVEGLTEESMVL